MEYDTNRLEVFKPKSEREAHITRALNNRYHIIKHLGEGGSGASVFAVYNKLLDRVEALKVLSDDLTRDSDFIDRFKDEAKISASLAHPNIVTIYEYQNLNNLYFFTMLYIDGPSLADFTKSPGSMPVHRVCTTIATVCDAIDYAHQRGIIHRDLKVSNIILNQSGKPYVTDFGIAKWEKSQTLTHTGQILGSPHYVSPEQAAGKEIDARSDIYALGVTLYVLLTQHYPFKGDTPHLTIAQRLYQAPTPPQTYNPGIHPRLIEILDKTLQKKRQDRYQSTAALARALNDFVHSGAGAAEERIPAVLRRKKLLERFDPSRLSKVSKKWLVSGVALVALIVAVSLFVTSKPKDQADRAAIDNTRHPVQAKVSTHNVKINAETKSMTTPTGQKIQQQEEEQPPFLPDNSSAEPVSPPADDIVQKYDPPIESENKIPESDNPESSDQQNFIKDLISLMDNLKKEYLSGKYEACLKTADNALHKLESLPADRKADFSNRKTEINQYKTLAEQKLSQQKFEQELNRLAAKTARHFQNGDYASCMYTASTAISKIKSLGASQQKRYAGIKKKVIAYQEKAAKANQIRKKQQAVLEKIEKNIAENKLKEAISLVDAMLVQEANLSPKIHDTLLAYRKKIKQLLKENS